MKGRGWEEEGRQTGGGRDEEDVAGWKGKVADR